MKHPCKQCPFVEGSKTVYDADAMAALDEENQPSCHMQVDHCAIFSHAPMTPPEGTECAGYEAWCNGQTGFQKPMLERPP